MKNKTIQMSIGRDINGNKTVRLQFHDYHGKSATGFSIQTNGNLPETDRSNKPNLKEIIDFIKNYGTERQKAIIEKYAC